MQVFVQKYRLVVSVGAVFIGLLISLSASASSSRCEYILTARPGKLTPSHSLHLDAYSILVEVLDLTKNGKVVAVAANLKPEALAVFNLGGLSRPQSTADLRIDTAFDVSEGAEVSLSVRSGETRNEEFRKLIIGSKSILFFWKKVGTKDDSRQDIVSEFHSDSVFLEGGDWARLPLDGEVGFRSLEIAGTPAIFVMGQYRPKRIVLGIDVACSEIEKYVTSLRYVQRIILPNKSILCRIPILRTTGTLDRIYTGGPGRIVGS